MNKRVELPTKRITAEQAIAKAHASMGNAKWKVVFLSNRGVSQTVTGVGTGGPDGGRMHKDGKAIQWIVEMYTQIPEKIGYGPDKEEMVNYQVIQVTDTEAIQLPPVYSSRSLAPLKSKYVQRLDAARQLAIREVKKNFDVITVAFDVKSNGVCSWRFFFYKLNSYQAVDGVHISGDGKKILKW